MADGAVLLEWRGVSGHRAHRVSVELYQETELSHGVCLTMCAGEGETGEVLLGHVDVVFE